MFILPPPPTTWQLLKAFDEVKIQLDFKLNVKPAAYSISVRQYIRRNHLSSVKNSASAHKLLKASAPTGETQLPRPFALCSIRNIIYIQHPATSPALERKVSLRHNAIFSGSTLKTGSRFCTNNESTFSYALCREKPERTCMSEDSQDTLCTALIVDGKNSKCSLISSSTKTAAR